MSRALELDRIEPRRGLIRLDDELVLAGLAILAISLLYLAVTGLLGVPGASGLFGHSLGILGFALMLATETLYSWRKRSGGARWGRMSSWLKFHIFTGLVGPYLVFLHAAWKFHGLAGITLLMTGIVVISGFFGRYIYTAVPRTAEGAILERAEVERLLAAAEAELTRIQGERVPAEEPRGRTIAVIAEGRTAAGLPGEPPARTPRQPGPLAGALLVLGRFLFAWRDAWRAWVRQRGLEPQARLARARVSALVRRRDELERQLATLAAARRLIAAWHTLHVPLGLMMFSAAVLHIGAAIYYATLLK